MADSLSRRRFCRIPLPSPAPHPTTLVKLVRRSSPQIIEQLDATLLGKLAEPHSFPGPQPISGAPAEADLLHAAAAHRPGPG